MGLGIAIAVGGTPDPELSDAVVVEVHECMGETTTYRIRYGIDISEEGDFAALTDARLDPGSELAVIAPLQGKNHYLVKGPVTGQHAHYAHGGGGSYVEVHGADSSVVMDRETKAVLWADVTDSDAVSTIVGQYGYTPDVSPTQAGHFEQKHALVQRNSDLRFVRQLARRNGFLFWISWDASGAGTAHFKRPSLDGDAVINLDINLSTNNLAAVDLTWDVERPTSVVAAQLNLNDKSTIEGDVARSPLNTLGTASLADITGDPRSVQVVAPVDDAGDLHARGEGALIEAGWFVRATCQTSVNALGTILRPNTIVNLRGVGKRHSGKYYVASVRHVIDSSAHAMDVELIRNGWGN
jgi:phage protein D